MGPTDVLQVLALPDLAAKIAGHLDARSWLSFAQSCQTVRSAFRSSACIQQISLGSNDSGDVPLDSILSYMPLPGPACVELKSASVDFSRALSVAPHCEVLRVSSLLPIVDDSIIPAETLLQLNISSVTSTLLLRCRALRDLEVDSISPEIASSCPRLSTLTVRNPMTPSAVVDLLKVLPNLQRMTVMLKADEGRNRLHSCVTCSDEEPLFQHKSLRELFLTVGSGVSDIEALLISCSVSLQHLGIKADEAACAPQFGLCQLSWLRSLRLEMPLTMEILEDVLESLPLDKLEIPEDITEAPRRGELRVLSSTDLAQMAAIVLPPGHVRPVQKPTAICPACEVPPPPKE
mmetsp:Transcript_38730/g.62737  ORF Transcript_38730/g.62737 Transcript_38730/m.62737 type:complete len:348 (+) Transcript_38730:209-1252(+)|eukprot:CAMPEP_0184647434 /NCGR_PEP_ID=MMETSP0308-20130426/4354_1 /TAXON_ID=38269 /ORGANISM="Gloeochaete witrockiana, Strain SAG 46.84" /LENGTH=347 /DNA_ID=CAMNT_0027078377 /DNA_START=129 /DNA_END=1172 /DNA_ORIENTATION=-